MGSYSFGISLRNLTLTMGQTLCIHGIKNNFRGGLIFIVLSFSIVNIQGSFFKEKKMPVCQIESR